MIRQTISHYKILEKLGEGGMGVVYKAEDTKLKRTVALKFLPPHFSADDEAKQRFMHEAQAASALNHTNICSIHAIEEFEKQQFIDMEFIEGKTLGVLLKEKELSLKEVVDIALQIAEGLNTAHKKGIVHRDIKPDNIMITDENLVKIMDFGLAKLKGSSKLTKTRSTLGTISYMSPEQARGEEVDQRSDIFSLGAVLYEMITGRRPVKGEHEAAIIYSLVNETPEPLARYKSDVPCEMQRVIDKALAKEKDKRYQHVDEMLTDLRRVQEETPRPTKAKRKATKLPLLIGAGIAVVALVILVYFFLVPKSVPPGEKSIAVLPFIDMSPQKDHEYFSDGMTEELTNALTKIEGLQVASRTSTFQFKGREEDIRTIGKELAVSTVLEGSVRKAGNKLRITAQLISVANGYHLWSDTYERDMKDVFAIQEEISRKIADALKIKLVGERATQFVKHYTDNLEAYNLYLKGRYYWNKRTEEGFKKAIDYFQQAIDRDPTYALAYAGLADCYNLLCAYCLLPPKESVPKARVGATTALGIDSSLAEAHEAVAHVKMLYDWNWVEAEQEFKRAIDLNPKFATAYQRYAIYLTAVGRVQEAAAKITRAQELDPLSLIINTDVGLILYLGRQYNEAIEQYRKTLEMDPNFAVAHFGLGLAYEQTGKFEEAIAELQKAVTQSGESTIMLATLGHTFAAHGKLGEARRILAQLEQPSTRRYVSPYSLAVIYAGLGEKNVALRWLQKAYEDRSVWQIHLCLSADPRLGSLRFDPRFTAVLNMMGLEK